MNIDEINSLLENKKAKLFFNSLSGDNFEFDINLKIGTGGKYFGDAIFYKLKEAGLFECGVNLLDKGSYSSLSDYFSNNGFLIYSNDADNAKDMEENIFTYVNLFKLLAVILFISSVFFIFFTGYRSVKSKRYDIGVLKAMGTPIGDISRIYIINFFLQLFISLTFYFLFVFILKYLANEILVASLLEIFAGINPRISFTIFNYKIINLITDISIIIISSLFGTIIPLIAIKNIKPVEIIRCKY